MLYFFSFQSCFGLFQLADHHPLASGSNIQSDLHTHMAPLYCLETELIITTTNVCCLHLWVYVFTSVFLYVFACEKQFEFQTFGERTVVQAEVILNLLYNSKFITL